MSCPVQGDRWVYKPGSPGWEAAQERLSSLMLKVVPRPEAAVMKHVLGGVVQMHQRMAREWIFMRTPAWLVCWLLRLFGYGLFVAVHGWGWCTVHAVCP